MLVPRLTASLWWLPLAFFVISIIMMFKQLRWLSRLSDVLPSQHPTSDRTWEEFVNILPWSWFSPGSPVSSHREKLDRMG